MTSSKVITVGLASYGMSGSLFHAPFLSVHPGFVLRSIVERTAHAAGRHYPGTKICRTYAEMLDDPGLDLVVVNTPDPHHAEHARLALEAGKHVVVEKPFTLTVADGAALIDLARSKQRMLAVFQNRRWDGDFMTVRRLVSDGRLGRVFEYEAHFDRFRPVVAVGTWKEEAASGTGTTFNLGSHLIDQALVLFGRPRAVSAVIRTIREHARVDDWFDIRLHYESLLVTLRASYLVPDPGPRYTVRGPQGSFVKSGTDPQEEALKRGERPRTPGWGQEAPETWGTLALTTSDGSRIERVPTEAGDYGLFYDNLHAHLTEGVPLAVPAEEGLEVIRVIEAAHRSSRTGLTCAYPSD
jgi:predicted dehydrogenase